MTSPLSSASAASKAIRRDPEFEPDDQWKENLKAEIQLNLASMVKDAEAQRDDNLKKNPADSERSHREFSIAMDNIRKLATETYKAELDRERHERRWATGHELPPDLAETLEKEQQAIRLQMTSPLSSASAASKAIRRDPEFEPDDQWKENLKAEIQLNLASMVKDAEAQRDDNLKKNPADSERSHREFSIAMDNIRKLATETYKAELDRERHDRRWATGHELPPDLAEALKKQQQAIRPQMTSPLSSASAASKAIRRDPEFEPDDQWKENLKAEIQLNLASMVKDAEAQRDDNLKKNPADSERSHREFSIAMDNIRKLATETYKAELDRERHDRRWATGHELPPDLAETMKKEQQAILDRIQSGKSSNTPAPNDGPTINNTQGSTNSLNRKSSTSSVSPSMNASSTLRLSKPTQRATLPEPEPPSDEETDEESGIDVDSPHNRDIKSQPIKPSSKARDDDDSGTGRSSWEPGSLNLNRIPRPYSSSTPPKASPEVWIPPELALDRLQRRNSTKQRKQKAKEAVEAVEIEERKKKELARQAAEDEARKNAKRMEEIRQRDADRAAAAQEEEARKQKLAEEEAEARRRKEEEEAELRRQREAEIERKEMEKKRKEDEAKRKEEKRKEEERKREEDEERRKRDEDEKKRREEEETRLRKIQEEEARLEQAKEDARMEEERREMLRKKEDELRSRQDEIRKKEEELLRKLSEERQWDFERLEKEAHRKEAEAKKRDLREEEARKMDAEIQERQRQLCLAEEEHYRRGKAAQKENLRREREKAAQEMIRQREEQERLAREERDRQEEIERQEERERQEKQEKEAAAILLQQKIQKEEQERIESEIAWKEHERRKAEAAQAAARREQQAALYRKQQEAERMQIEEEAKRKARERRQQEDEERKREAEKIAQQEEFRRRAEEIRSRKR